MAKCNFSIAFDTEPGKLIEKARHEILLAGGTFNGNDQSGSFSIGTPLGSVKGNYQIQAQIFVIDIIEKPMLVGCSRIEKELRRYMETTTLTDNTSDIGDTGLK